MCGASARNRTPAATVQRALSATNDTEACTFGDRVAISPPLRKRPYRNHQQQGGHPRLRSDRCQRYRDEMEPRERFELYPAPLRKARPSTRTRLGCRFNGPRTLPDMDWCRPRGSNSAATVCNTVALNQKARAALELPVTGSGVVMRSLGTNAAFKASPTAFLLNTTAPCNGATCEVRTHHPLHTKEDTRHRVLKRPGAE